MRTMEIEEAAKFLHMHPRTLQEKAKAGEIPGSKPGRKWVFVDVDLIEYLRSQYSSRALQGDKEQECPNHSTNAKTRRTGGVARGTRSQDDEYSNLLGLTTTKGRSNT